MGMLEVPSGSINVVPGRCKFSLDIRATTNEVRDACVDDVRAELARICERARPALQAGRNHARRGRAQRAGLACSAGSAPSKRLACRCSACPAAPATTR